MSLRPSEALPYPAALTALHLHSYSCSQAAQRSSFSPHSALFRTAVTFPETAHHTPRHNFELTILQRSTCWDHTCAPRAGITHALHVLGSHMCTTKPSSTLFSIRFCLRHMRHAQQILYKCWSLAEKRRSGVWLTFGFWGRG